METLFGMIKIVVIIFILATLLLYVFQKSLIFYPQKIAGHTREKYRSIEITVNSGNVLLHGWFVKKETALKKRLIIYYGEPGMPGLQTMFRG